MRHRHKANRARLLPLALGAAAAAALAGEARAEDLKVPRNYRTIEAALEVAQPGDRIVVTRGRHKDVIVHAPGVTVVGRGSARLEGGTRVTGEGSAVQGFHVKDAVYLFADGGRAEGLRLRRLAAISAEGVAGVVVRGNRAQGDAEIHILCDGATVQTNALPSGAVIVEGHGATVEGNAAESLTVFGASAVVRGNDVGATGVEVVGDGALVEQNVVAEGMIHLSGRESSMTGNTARGARAANADGLVAQDNSFGGWGLEVVGDGVVIEGNGVSPEDGFFPAAGIAVAGDGTRVLGNDVFTNGTAVSTWGADVEVSGNYVRAGYGTRRAGTGAIVAYVDGGVTLIQGNGVRHGATGGIVVDGDGATVAANAVVAAGEAPGHGIQVTGDGALVTENSCEPDDNTGGNASGIVIDGNANRVAGNVVYDSKRDGIAIRHGGGNVVVDCVIVAARRCGIRIQGAATASIVTAVRTENCLVGVMNLAQGTDLTDSALAWNRLVDVLAVTTLSNFSGCTFNTFATDITIDPTLGDED